MYIHTLTLANKDEESRMSDVRTIRLVVQNNGVIVGLTQLAFMGARNYRNTSTMPMGDGCWGNVKEVVRQGTFAFAHGTPLDKHTIPLSDLYDAQRRYGIGVEDWLRFPLSLYVPFSNAWPTREVPPEDLPYIDNVGRFGEWLESARRSACYC